LSLRTRPSSAVRPVEHTVIVENDGVVQVAAERKVRARRDFRIAHEQPKVRGAYFAQETWSKNPWKRLANAS